MASINVKGISDYLIHKLKMDQENYNFNRQEFIDELSNFFLDAIENYPIKNPKTDAITYRNFKNIIDEFRKIFNKISQGKKGKPLTEGLWNYFYADTIIPYRKYLFPRVQDKIDAHKALTIANRIKKS